MARVSLVVAALVGAIVAVQGQEPCTYRYANTQCVALGLDCSVSTGGAVTRMCNDLANEFCYEIPSGLGECKLRPSVNDLYGEQCTTSEDCITDAGLDEKGVGLLCVTDSGLPEDDRAPNPGRCLMAFGMPGDYCTLPQECVTNQCGADNRCTGFASGASCQSNPSGCGPGLYCNTGDFTCQPHQDFNTACDLNQPDRPCKKGSECSAVTKKCEKYFTNPDGTSVQTEDVLTSYLLCESVIALGAPPANPVCSRLPNNQLGEQCKFEDWISNPAPLSCSCSNDNTMRLDLNGQWLNSAQIKGFHDCLANSDCDRFSNPFRLGSCAYYKCFPWAEQMHCNNIRMSEVSYFQPNNCAKNVLQSLGEECDKGNVMPCKIPKGLPDHLCVDPNRNTGGGGGGDSKKGGEIAAAVIFGLIVVGAIGGAMFWWNKKKASEGSYGGVSYGAPVPTAGGTAKPADSAYSTL